MTNASTAFQKLSKTIRRHRWLLLILALGALLRFAYLDYGLPRLYLEDEEFFVTPALRVAHGSLNPNWFGAPGHALIYATAAEFRVINKIVDTLQHTKSGVTKNYRANRTPFQLTGRVLPALAGTAMILFAYLLGGLWNRRTGLFAALLVATSFYLVDQSHIIRPDILQTALIMAALYSALRLLDAPHQWRWYIFLGVTFGVALSAKYPTLFLIPPLLLFAVTVWRSGGFSFRRWLTAAGSAVGATFLTGPYLFLDFRGVLRDLAVENRAQHGGHDALHFSGNLWWYLSRVLTWELGTVLYVVTIIVAGVLLFWLVRRRRLDGRAEKMGLIFITALAYLLAISTLKLHWFRWIIPVQALLFIVTAIGLDWITRVFRSKPVLIALLLAACFFGPAIRLARTMYGYSHPFTTETARLWILQNIPKGSYFITEPFTPELPSADYQAFKTHNLSWFPTEHYRSLGATHFMLTGRVHNVITKEAVRFGPNSNYALAAERYERLFANGTLLYQIANSQLMTEDRLLYSTDLGILSTLRLDLQRGPYVAVFALNPTGP